MRLRRDTRGAAAFLMAAMVVPLLLLAGSAIDVARVYTVKSRLQQACDAGVLAGRKFMDMSNTGPTLDSNAAARAQDFFSNNFRAGWLAGKSVSFTPSKTSDNLVAGNASVVVPMTLMAVFGQPEKTITVICQARFDVADTDIVFVLDTTGSMSCLPSDNDATCDNYVYNAGTASYSRPADSSLQASSGQTGSANDSVLGYPGSTGYYVPEKSGSRIAAVRQAVTNFYTTVAANIGGTQTRVRYGFVTYSSSINAGKAIMNASPSYMIGGSGSTGGKTWTYQSRFIDPNKVSQYQVSQSTAYDTTITSSNCNGSSRTPVAVAGQPYTFDTTSRATVVGKAWDASKGQCLVTTTKYGPLWTYGPATFDVSGFVTGASVIDPSKLDGSTSSWLGCIEERDTTPGVSSFSTTSLPGDLDPDLMPTSDATRWRPMWPETIYWRNYVITSPQTWYGSTGNVMDIAGNAGDTDKNVFYYAQDSSGNYVPDAFSLFYYGSNTFVKSGVMACGKPIRRVSLMTQQDVTNFVNASDFRPMGGTYHDAGMIWGTRLLSTNGVFKNDLTPQVSNQVTNKVIIFLTDGAMSPSLTSYGMYGLEYFDKRVTGGDYNPPAAASPNTQQTAYHNARFLAECAKARAMNISVWTVMITTNTATTPQLAQCATTSGQALFTSSGSDLNQKFQAIAKQVAMLRISQ